MKTIMTLLTHILICFPILFLFENSLGGAWMTLLYGALTALAAVGCSLSRWRAKKIIWFLVSHVLLITGGIVILPLAGLKTWYLIIWVAAILYSAILRLVPQAENLDAPGYLYVGTMLVVYLAAGALGGLVIAEKLSLWTAIFLFLINMLYSNLDEMEQFLQLQSLTDKPDEKKVTRINTKLSFIYTGVFGVILAIIGLNSMEGVKDKILQGLGALLRFIVSLLPLKEKAPAEEEQVMEQEGMQNLLQNLPEPSEQSRFQELIADILQGIVAVCIVALIIFILVRAAIIAYRHFYKQTTKEEDDRVIEKISQTEKITKKKRIGLFEGIDRTPAKKIRKIYKKSMIKLGAKTVSRFRFLTPTEQVVLLREQGIGETDIREIRNIYEKARYYENVVTNEDVEKIRTML